jgi:hypothetical protein
MPIGDNKYISLGGEASYLSRVATVTRPAAAPPLSSNYVAGSDVGNVIYDSTGAGTPSESLPILSFGDMWALTGTISFGGTF